MIIIIHLMKKQLYLACLEGDVETVKRLSEQQKQKCQECHDMLTRVYGVDEKITEPVMKNIVDWNRVLFHACQGGDQREQGRNHKLIVDIAIENGAHDGPLALMGCCMSENTNMVSYLLEKGLKINETHYVYAMKKACEYGHLDFVKLMFHYGVKDNIGGGFIEACRYGHVHIIPFLLEKSHVKSFKALNNSSLATACRHNQIQVVEYLLDHDHDHSFNMTNFEQGFYESCKKGHQQLVDFWITRGVTNWKTGLEGAIEGDHPQLIKFFLQKISNDEIAFLRRCIGKHNVYKYREIIEMFVAKGVKFGLSTSTWTVTSGPNNIRHVQQSITERLFCLTRLFEYGLKNIRLTKFEMEYFMNLGVDVHQFHSNTVQKFMRPMMYLRNQKMLCTRRTLNHLIHFAQCFVLPYISFESVNNPNLDHLIRRLLAS